MFYDHFLLLSSQLDFERWISVHLGFPPVRSIIPIHCNWESDDILILKTCFFPFLRPLFFWFHLSLDIQNPPNTWWVGVWNPEKPNLRGCLGVQTSILSPGVWMSRVWRHGGQSSRTLVERARLCNLHELTTMTCVPIHHLKPLSNAAWKANSISTIDWDDVRSLLVGREGKKRFDLQTFDAWKKLHANIWATKEKPAGYFLLNHWILVV